MKFGIKVDIETDDKGMVNVTIKPTGRAPKSYGALAAGLGFVVTDSVRRYMAGLEKAAKGEKDGKASK